MNHFPSLVRFAVIASIAALLMNLSGCAKNTLPAQPGAPSTNATLQKVVQVETDTATGINAALQIVTTFYTAGKISKSDAQNITAVLATITNANTQAIALTKNLTTISATQALTLQNLEAPIIQALQTLVTSGLAGIKDAATQAAVSASLSTLLVTLQIIQGISGS